MTTEASSSFQTHLSADAAVASSPEFVAQCNVTDYEPLYQRSIADVEAYWEEQAKQFEWFAPWTKVRQIDYPYARWFIDGKCNITVNCLDRHANGERKNKAALIWLSEDGKERIYTYAMLHRRVQQAANALKGLGVGKGDRAAPRQDRQPVLITLNRARVAQVDVRKIGTDFTRCFFNGISGRYRIRDVPDKREIGVIREPDNLRRDIAARKVAVSLKADPDAVGRAPRHLMQTRGDVVARLTTRRTRPDLVGENANERRAESGGEFSVSESYLDLLASLVRVSRIKRA